MVLFSRGFKGHLQTTAGPGHCPGQLELAKRPAFLNLTGSRVAVGSERLSAFMGAIVDACLHMIFHHLAVQTILHEDSMKIVSCYAPPFLIIVSPKVGPLGSQSNLVPGVPVGNALRNFSEVIGNGVSTSNGQDAGQTCT